jgi:hypothetical protein
MTFPPDAVAGPVVVTMAKQAVYDYSVNISGTAAFAVCAYQFTAEGNTNFAVPVGLTFNWGTNQELINTCTASCSPQPSCKSKCSKTCTATSCTSAMCPGAYSTNTSLNALAIECNVAVYNSSGIKVLPSVKNYINNTIFVNVTHFSNYTVGTDLNFSEENEGGIPETSQIVQIIGILAILIVIGVLLFKKR